MRVYLRYFAVVATLCGAMEALHAMEKEPETAMVHLFDWRRLGLAAAGANAVVLTSQIFPAGKLSAHNAALAYFRQQRGKLVANEPLNTWKIPEAWSAAPQRLPWNNAVPPLKNLLEKTKMLGIELYGWDCSYEGYLEAQLAEESGKKCVILDDTNVTHRATVDKLKVDLARWFGYPVCAAKKVQRKMSYEEFRVQVNAAYSLIHITEDETANRVKIAADLLNKEELIAEDLRKNSELIYTLLSIILGSAPLGSQQPENELLVQTLPLSRVLSRASLTEAEIKTFFDNAQKFSLLTFLGRDELPKDLSCGAALMGDIKTLEFLIKDMQRRKIIINCLDKLFDVGDYNKQVTDENRLACAKILMAHGAVVKMEHQNIAENSSFPKLKKYILNYFDLFDGIKKKDLPKVKKAIEDGADARVSVFFDGEYQNILDLMLQVPVDRAMFDFIFAKYPDLQARKELSLTSIIKDRDVLDIMVEKFYDQCLNVLRRYPSDRRYEILSSILQLHASKNQHSCDLVEAIVLGLNYGDLPPGIGSVVLATGCDTCFDELVKRGMKFHLDEKSLCKHYTYYQELARAINNTDKKEVQKLLKNKKLEMRVALRMAIDLNNLEMVQYLVKEHNAEIAFICSPGARGLLPLTRAIILGDRIAMVEYFINTCLLKNTCAIWNGSYVYDALMGNGPASDDDRLACAKLLIEHGSCLNPNTTSDQIFKENLDKSTYAKLKKYLLANFELQKACCNIPPNFDAAKKALEDGAWVNLRVMRSGFEWETQRVSLLYCVIDGRTDQSNLIDLLIGWGVIVTEEDIAVMENMICGYARRLGPLGELEESGEEKNLDHLKKALAQRAALKEEFASQESYLGTYQPEAKKGGKLPLDLQKKLLEYVFSPKKEKPAKKTP